jgi:hypothetical protein
MIGAEDTRGGDLPGRYGPGRSLDRQGKWVETVDYFQRAYFVGAGAIPWPWMQPRWKGNDRPPDIWALPSIKNAG